MVTLKDVAERAGVSATTVSAALRNTNGVSPQKAEQIRAIARDMGYLGNASARVLRTGRSRSLTVFVSSLVIPYYGLLSTLLDEEISAQGYEASIRQLRFTHTDEKTLLQEVISQSSTDGFIFLSTSLSPARIAQYTGGKPTVIIDDWSKQRILDTVRTPSVSGMKTAVDHLADDCGRTHIAVIGQLPNTPRSRSAALASRRIRIQAAQNALRERGLALSSDPLQQVNWSVEGGVEAGHRLAAQYREHTHQHFDAAIAMNDLVGLGLLRGLADGHVRVPQDIAVIGFDGIAETSYSVPRLSTISVDYRGIARTAVSLILDRLDHPEEHQSAHCVIAGYQLIARESTIGTSDLS